jgi:drug/metabolite transporter (DMT)-like permease
MVIALMALLSATWGSTWVVIGLGLTDVPPFTGAALRFILAGAVMAAIAPLLARREGGGRAPRLVVWAQAFCQFGFNYALVYMSETILPSGLVSVLWATFPLMMALAAHFITKRERLGARQWSGMLLAFSGIVLLFATDVAEVGPRGLAMAFLVLLAPASVVWSTLLIKYRAGGASSAYLNRDSMLLGAGMLLALALVFERDLPVRLTPTALFSILYLALIGSVLGFGVYLWLLRSVPAYRLSIISFMVPVFALVLGAVVRGEPLGVTTAFGALLVLSGVGLTLRRLARPPA